jgi:phosphatidylglycerol:prolipoprotein diacylglycerol transferase
VILAAAWGFGFSKLIKNVTIQRVTQVAAFIPAVLLFIALQPAPGTFGNAIEFSTSQFIALATGVAASAAFAVYYKAALARPKHAMDLGLPAEFMPGFVPASAPAAEDDDEEVRRADDDDAEEAPIARPVPTKVKTKTKTKKKLKKKATREPEPEPEPKKQDHDPEKAKDEELPEPPKED